MPPQFGGTYARATLKPSAVQFFKTIYLSKTKKRNNKKKDLTTSKEKK